MNRTPGSKTPKGASGSKRGRKPNNQGPRPRRNDAREWPFKNRIILGLWQFVELAAWARGLHGGVWKDVPFESEHFADERPRMQESVNTIIDCIRKEFEKHFINEAAGEMSNWPIVELQAILASLYRAESAGSEEDEPLSFPWDWTRHLELRSICELVDGEPIEERPEESEFFARTRLSRDFPDFGELHTQRSDKRLAKVHGYEEQADARTAEYFRIGIRTVEGIRKAFRAQEKDYFRRLEQYHRAREEAIGRGEKSMWAGGWPPSGPHHWDVESSDLRVLPDYCWDKRSGGVAFSMLFQLLRNRPFHCLFDVPENWDLLNRLQRILDEGEGDSTRRT